MGLKFENAFVVKAPIERVWAYLTDPYRVAPALPGAAITEKTDERTYKGTITVKVGPVSAKYKGTAVFERLDPATHTAEISARGQDLSGRGGADMKMTSSLVEKAPGETEVTIVSDVNVTGILAQFGRGLMQDVSDQMLKRFTDAMRAELEGAAEAAPAESNAAEAAAVVSRTLDPDLTLPPTEGPPPSNPSRTQPLPAQQGPASDTPVSAPIEVVSFGSQVLGRAALRALKKPIVWVLIFMLAVLIAVLMS
jgi:carbon monoxide dehydrogenase subunit G